MGNINVLNLIQVTVTYIFIIARLWTFKVNYVITVSIVLCIWKNMYSFIVVFLSEKVKILLEIMCWSKHHNQLVTESMAGIHIPINTSLTPNTGEVNIIDYHYVYTHDIYVYIHDICICMYVYWNRCVGGSIRIWTTFQRAKLWWLDD